MKWLSLIASPARFEVLQVLYEAGMPLRLETIAKLTKLNVRQVRVALTQLIKGGVVTKKRQVRSFLYEIAKLPTALEQFLMEVIKEKMMVRF